MMSSGAADLLGSSAFFPEKTAPDIAAGAVCFVVSGTGVSVRGWAVRTGAP